MLSPLQDENGGMFIPGGEKGRHLVSRARLVRKAAEDETYEYELSWKMSVVMKNRILRSKMKCGLRLHGVWRLGPSCGIFSRGYYWDVGMDAVTLSVTCNRFKRPGSVTTTKNHSVAFSGFDLGPPF